MGVGKFVCLFVCLGCVYARNQGPLSFTRYVQARVNPGYTRPLVMTWANLLVEPGSEERKWLAPRKFSRAAWGVCSFPYYSGMDRKAMIKVVKEKAICATKQKSPQLVWLSVYPPH